MSIVVNKTLPFRGGRETFSNRYLFQTGSNTVDAAFVQSVYVAVRDMERGRHSADVKFIGGWGGIAGEDAIFSRTESPELAGTRSVTFGTHPETCVMAESKIQNRVYLRKFYHSLADQAGTSTDTRASGENAGWNTALAILTNGTLPGGVIACRPNGALATVPFTVDPYLRTRQMKRRGRRPTPASG